MMGNFTSGILVFTEYLNLLDCIQWAVMHTLIQKSYTAYEKKCK